MPTDPSPPTAVADAARRTAVAALHELAIGPVLAVDGAGRIIHLDPDAAILLGVDFDPTRTGSDVFSIPAARRGTELGAVIAAAISGTRVVPIPGAPYRVAPLAGGGAVVVLTDPGDDHIDSQRLRSRLERAVSQRTESDTLAQVARELANAGSDLSASLDRLAEGAAMLLHAEGAVVARIEGSRFRVDAAVGVMASFLGVSADSAPSLAAEAVATRRPVISNVAATDRRVDQRFLDRMELRHAVVAPLISEDEAVGVLIAINSVRGAFTIADGALLQRLADHGALAIRNSRLLMRADRSAREAQALSDIIRHINQSLELERVVTLIAGHAARLLGGRGARLSILEDDMFVVHAAVGAASGMVGTRSRIDDTFCGEVVRSKRPLRTHDLLSDARWEQRETLGGVGRSNAVSAPLLVGDRPIGAVLVFGNDARDFTAEDEQLLLTLASHAAIAVENARLYRAAAQTARHAGILAATARSLAFNVTPQSLFDGIARVAADSLRADGFSIFLADLARDHVRLVHAHGVGASDSASIVPGFWENRAGHVFASGLPDFIADVRLSPAGEGDPRMRALAEAGVRSLALLPLLVEGRAQGLLTLRFVRPHPFDEPERQLFTDFATQVAIAMRNAALFSDLERRAARLAAVAKVQQAISRTALHDVYGEIHRAVASSVGDAPCFALLIADESATRFLPQLIVVEGITTWASALAPIPIDDCLASRTYRSGRPLIGTQPTRTWADIAPGQGRGRAVASELAAPIVYGERTLGVLIVQSFTAGAFSLDDVDVVSIIARQAGVAIENARLFEAQRSERELAEAAATISRVALAAATTGDAASAILEVLDRVVPSAGKALALSIDGGSALRYIGATGTSIGGRTLTVPVERSIARDVVASGEPARPAAPHHGDGPPLDAALAQGGVILPLTAKSRVLGVLTASASGGAALPAPSVDSLRRLASTVALAIDVQLLGEEERKRRERERMLATALATMDQPVFILSLERRVLYANAAAMREYGYHLDELVEMSIDSLVASAVPARHQTAGVEEFSSGSMIFAEHVHRRRDGSQFPAAVALSFIRQDSGSPVGQVLTVRNLTEDRRIAEQLRQSEKLAALGELVAGVAHELNNPLAGISAFAQLMLEEELTPDQHESVRLIKRESDRAVAVIRDLLLFARKTGPSTAPVDVNGLVELTLRLRAYSLRSSGVEIESDLDPSHPEVAGDDQKLQQVILNLLVNAEYAMQRSPIRRLSIRTARRDDHVVISISDTGSGMGTETQQRIFEPFFTTKPAGDGTGLGLSVSYGIVEAHGGTIAVDSELDRGTTFHITLPAVATARVGVSADV